MRDDGGDGDAVHPPGPTWTCPPSWSPWPSSARDWRGRLPARSTWGFYCSIIMLIKTMRTLSIITSVNYWCWWYCLIWWRLGLISSSRNKMTLFFDVLKIEPLSSRDDLPCRQLHGRCKVSRSRRCTAPVWWELMIYHDQDDDGGDDDGVDCVGDVWRALLTYISLHSDIIIIIYHIISLLLSYGNCRFVMIMTTMVAMMIEMIILWWSRPSWRCWQPPKTDPNDILLLIIFLQGSLNAFSYIILQRLACKLI